MTPKIFISYSWDSEEHKSWVRKLGEKLQQNGINVNIDQWNAYLGIDLPNYMETSIRESDFVLLICTPNYALKADQLKGGVGYEKMIVTGEIFQNTATPKKFVPIIRIGSQHESLPSYLKSKLFVDFTDDVSFDNNITKLLRHFYEEPEFIVPSLGTKPKTFRSHTVQTSSNKKMFCSKCGIEPGSYSTCIRGEQHNFLLFQGNVICSKCGKEPGSYSTCIGGKPHDYRIYQ